MTDSSNIFNPPAATTLDRVKYLISKGRMTQAQFAKQIGMNPSNLSKILLGKMPVGETMLNRIVVNMGVSKHWLTTGEGVPYEKTSGSVPEVIPDEGGLGGKSTPIYDIDVTAGRQELSSLFTDDRIVGCVNLPNLPNMAGEDGAIVSVSGDSMTPVIKNGAFLAIRRVPLGAPIHWGQIYVVVLDDYRMVKFVRRHSHKGMVVLHSANPAYDDMDIPLSDIKALYLVEGILTYEKRC